MNRMIEKNEKKKRKKMPSFISKHCKILYINEIRTSELKNTYILKNIYYIQPYKIYVNQIQMEKKNYIFINKQ